MTVAIQDVTRGSGGQQVALFDLGHANGIFDERVRDGGSEPWRLLRDRLSIRGYELLTADIADESRVVYELHLELKQGFGTLASLISIEPPQVLAKNYSKEVESRYEHIFTWHDGLAGQGRYVKSCFPNVIPPMVADDPVGRDRFCCVIAGNKSVRKYDPRELYSERVRAIRWFERNAPQDFDLYGTDWDLPPPMPGLIGKVEKLLWRYASRFLKLQPFPSYRGKVTRKRDVLRRTKFSICYENVRDLPGYITEKIFDCFVAGCVPVYWGANNVADHIPPGCYIDRRQFSDTAAVYAYLKTMDEATYCGYQQRIADFLASDAAKPFGAEAFVETIVSTIVKDLGRGA